MMKPVCAWIIAAGLLAGAVACSGPKDGRPDPTPGTDDGGPERSEEATLPRTPGPLTVTVGADDRGPEQSGEVTFPLTPNPLTVTVELDAGRSTSALVSPTGGSISALALDGTRYTLVIPANALLSDEVITITPVSGIEGFPLSGGLVGGVNFEPEGLMLLEAATLTIETAGAADMEGFQTVGFAYYGSGEEFHLTPVSVAGNTLTLSMQHFSGSGGGRGTAKDIRNQQQNHPPTRVEDQARQLFYPTAEATLLPVWWDGLKRGTGLEARLESASKSGTGLEAAAREFLEWAKAVEEEGLAQDPEFAFNLEAGWGFLGLGAWNLSQRAVADCRNGQFARALDVLRWLTWAKSRPQLAEALGESRMTEMADMVKSCLVFELVFDSRFENTGMEALVGVPGGGRPLIVHVQAAVELRLHDSLSFLEGEGPLIFIEFDADVVPALNEVCVLVTAEGNTTFRVFEAMIGLNFNEKGRRAAPTVILLMDPGTTAETARYECPQNKVYPLVPDAWPVWSEMFENVHEEEKSAEGGFRITDWGTGERNFFAKKIYQRTAIEFQGKEIKETTVFLLRHSGGR